MGRPGPPSDLCTVTWKWFPEQPSLMDCTAEVSPTSPVNGERQARSADAKLGGALGEDMQP